MKLKKREITLNERDSVQDMLRLEERLCFEYEKGAALPLKKETENEVAALSALAREEVESLERCWKKSMAESL